MKKINLFLAIILIIQCNLLSQVKYDEGRVIVNGIQLLQDKDDPLLYYYLPQYPKLAEKEDGGFELLCLKYVGRGGDETNGGIFHALVEFTLPDDLFDPLLKGLRKIVPSARIGGPVPLLQTMKDGEVGMAGFQIISSILNNTKGDNPFTETVISSGYAPLLPGSKAAVAANLSQDGASLLWESLQGPTSDVSIAINGYYEAYVKGYNAVITADMSTIYKHFSTLSNIQQKFTRDQIRNISDSLVQSSTFKVEVFDRSEGLGIKSADMQGIVNIVTNKLIELMFDSKTGWSRVPEAEIAVDKNQIPGRQKKGWLNKLLAGLPGTGSQDQKYISDNQFVLKNREDVRINTFYMNLNKGTTIKVPVYTSGNIGGDFYRTQASDPDNRYFRIINLDDPAFQKRDVYFQVDGKFSEAFNDILNFVSVSFRKRYSNNQNDVTSDLVFKKDDLESGKDIQMVSYPRLGTKDSEWLEYEYKLNWSFKGNDKIVQVPEGAEQWLAGSNPAVTLIPPFDKRVITVDADRSYFEEAGIRSASIRFFVILNGKAQVQKTFILRSDDTESTTQFALYHDKGEPAIYQVTWYLKDQTVKLDPVEVRDDYLFLVPPMQ